MNTHPLLEVDDLFAGYGSIRVLNGVSLKVQSGSITALLGSNGAGKTTLMRTIVGLVQPDRGQILHQGTPIHRLPPQQRVEMGIVLVPEGRKVFSDFTVEENLKLGAFVPRARGRMSTTLEEMYAFFPRLAERRRQAARTMSGGEQQMLALARGLMSRPHLLMLDEPSLGLAPVITAQLFQIIQQIRDNSVTIFIVEQNVQTTLQIADHAYVVDQGKVVLEGPGAVLAKEPRIRAAYLGM
jgi:branched-chain amino acid transport system ATP-binding protein